MDVALLLGVAGVVLTVAFGVWGLALTIRTRYPGAVTIFIENVIPLFESIVQSVPDLGVTYRGSPVQPGLSLIKLLIVNTGKIDIEPGMVEKDIAVTLPDAFKWLAVTIVGAAPNVIAKAEIIAEGLVVRTGLFRAKEFVRLDIVLQVPPTLATDPAGATATASRLKDSLAAAHRISNTRPVKVTEISSSDSDVVPLAVMMLVVCSLGFMLFGSLLWQGLPVRMQYKTTLNGATTWVTVEPHENNKITVQSEDGKYNAQLAADEFYLKRIQATRTKPFTWMISVPIVLAVGAVISTYWILTVLYRRRRMRHLLAASVHN